MNSSKIPALGERRAASGLAAQYKVAAVLTYQALIAKRLEAVRVADPEAGRVDDFQVLTPGRLDGYQIKWSRFPVPFTLNGLTSATGDERSLIAQIADGWKRLRKRNPDRNVVVHLVTNDYPSTRTADPLADFMEECWKPCARAGSEIKSTVPDRWLAAWDRLRSATGLSSKEFSAFVHACRLSFGFALLEPSEPGPLPPRLDEHTKIQDVRELASAILDYVAAPARPVEISRGQLLLDLGWQGRLELSHQHEFPAPTIPYHEIEPTAQALDLALAQTSGGYILLLGSPGSGKSTLLTQTLRYRPERVVRYYAFVPDSSNRDRGESANFLHDLTLMLDEQGFQTGQSLSRLDRAVLTKRLDDQIQLLHNDWLKTDRKTILLIDGLDHIHREQSPSRSLLADLPSPSSVPDGVYLLLGSQTDQLPGLPPNILGHIEETPNRRITMQPLPRSAVLRIVAKAKSSTTPTPEEMEKIYRISAGHPLALAYLVNRLQDKDTEVSKLLTEVEPFPGNIDKQYSTHWRQMQSDRDLVELLALLVRIRGPIELTWIERWGSQDALYALQQKFSYYFRRESSGRWYFFHNSFRIFLIEKTRQLPGVSSSDGDRSLFRKLADAAAQGEGPWNWNEIFYRVRAGEEAHAMALATIPCYREQFLAGRPWPEIRSDLEILLRLASTRLDVEDLAKLLFTGMEIEQRAFNLEEYAECPIPELFLLLGETRTALDSARQGLRTRLKPIDTLRFSAALARRGLFEEAQRCFDLSEPLELLKGGQPVAAHGLQENENLLETWVEVAPFFRGISDLLEVIGRIKHEGNRPRRQSAEDATREFRDRLRFRLLQALQKLHRWSDHSTVINYWDPENGEDWEPWCWGHVTAAREAFSAGQREVASSLVERLLDHAQQHDLVVEERVALAECVFCYHDSTQEAKRLLEGVSLQTLAELRPSSLSQNESAFRLRFYRLRAALGDNRPLSEIIPGRGQALIYFERALVIVARLWAAAWTKRPIPGSEFGLEAENALRLVFRRPRSWHPAEEHFGYVCRSLIGAARLHGAEAVEILRQVFEREWRQSDAEELWPVAVIQESALEFYRSEAPRSWVVLWCKTAGVRARQEANVPERLSRLSGQVLLWLDLGERSQAHATFEELLNESLGVHQKETQTNSWIRWAQLANVEDEAEAPSRIRILALGLCDLKHKEVLGYASTDLLEAAWKWKPSSAHLLFGWMSQHGFVSFTDALKVFVEQGMDAGGAAARIAGRLFENILMPLLGESDGDLVQRIVKSTETLGREESVARLVDSVLIAALGSARESWLVAIRQAIQEIGIPWSSIRAKVNGKTALDRLRGVLSETTESSPESARERTELYDRLRSEGVAKVLSDESFHPDSLPEDLSNLVLEESNAQDVKLLVELIRHRSPSVAWLNRIARRLVSLNETEEAWRVGEMALAAGKSTDWLWRFGDRERVKTFTILREINHDRGSELAFQRFVEDLLSFDVGYSSCGFEFDAIAPVLADSVPSKVIWEILGPYLEALFPKHGAMVVPDLEPGSNEPESPASVLTGLVLDWVNHPISYVAHGAQRLVMELVSVGEPSVISRVASVLSNPDQSRYRLLVCLKAVAETKPQALCPFASHLEQLALSLHYGERAAARHLLTRLGAPLLPEPNSRKLPSVYDLRFPKREESHSLTPVEASKPLPPTEDPVEVASLIRPELQIIGERAGIQSTALYLRATQVALDPSGHDVYEEERTLGRQLKNTGLSRYSFRRPRSESVRRAFFTILAELVDSGRLSPSEVADLESPYSDPTMLRLRPQARPACVPAISKRSDELRYCPEDWTTQASLSTAVLASPAPRSSDWIVLAEETRLSWLDWPRPTERRISLVTGSADWPTKSSREDFLRSYCQEWRGLASSYEHLRIAKRCLIVWRQGFRLETPGPSLLAFNPSVARELQWVFSDDGRFRWRDSDGNIMIESVWWQDGCPDYPPPELDAEVGEGWLVCASPEAWTAIQDLSTGLKVRLRVERTANGQETFAVEQ